MTEPNSPAVTVNDTSDSSLDIELLIDCVRCRRVIWDPSEEEYKNRNKKKEEWAAVCRVVYEDFDEKPDVIKNKICKELQVKWKSIRDAYIRNVRSQKKKSGDSAKNSKVYIYARQMEFLQNVRSHNQTEDSTAIDPIDPDESTQGYAAANIPDSNIQHDPSPSTLFRRRKKNIEENLEKYMEVVAKQSEATMFRQNDEDFNFLLSILPTMKQFSDMDKLKFRCDLLQLMMKYKDQSQSNVQPTPLQISSNTSSNIPIFVPTVSGPEDEQNMRTSHQQQMLQPPTSHLQNPLTGNQRFISIHHSPSQIIPNCGLNSSSFHSSLPKPSTTQYSTSIRDQQYQVNALSTIQSAETSSATQIAYSNKECDLRPPKSSSYKTVAKNKRQKVNSKRTSTITSGDNTFQDTDTLAMAISQAIYSPPSPESVYSNNSGDSLLSLR